MFRHESNYFQVSLFRIFVCLKDSITILISWIAENLEQISYRFPSMRKTINNFQWTSIQNELIVMNLWNNSVLCVYVMKTIERLLDRREVCAQRKREVLNRKWNERVYEPARSALLESASVPVCQASILTKQRLYTEYLNYMNGKVALASLPSLSHSHYRSFSPSLSLHFPITFPLNYV